MMTFEELQTRLQPGAVNATAFFEELADDIQAGVCTLSDEHINEFLVILNCGSADEMLAFLMGCPAEELLEMLEHVLTYSQTNEGDSHEPDDATAP